MTNLQLMWHFINSHPSVHFLKHGQNVNMAYWYTY